MNELTDPELVWEWLAPEQLRADLATSDLDPRLHHLRDAKGRHDVDLVIELADGRVIGIEITVDAAPGWDAARHLAWLGSAGQRPRSVDRGHRCLTWPARGHGG